ncbi:peptidase domain-containing ABC transporter [Methylotenera versatilis]|uniref:Cyclolysin secretion/processing ATP-binding protein CyaB n=1 Tax=Methylotenera versatilis (strain 301) TaxID=666681 RepID=D7DJN7_METV0|nr:peptidase domain-containing ABC transporter [Methylotenera versatilis]ADI28397.1 ABC transporter related protein [Methylotenera versatilis 301]
MAQPLNIDTFVWATGAFCQLNRVPYDASLLIKQFPPPYDVVNLQQALQSFGLNNSVKKFSIEQLPTASLPCLALLNPTPSPEGNTPVGNTEDQPAPINGVALVLRRDEKRLLVLQPNQAEPITVGIDDFAQQITGDFLVVRKVEETVADDGSTISAINAAPNNNTSAKQNKTAKNSDPKEFGFRWFIPELLKYKRIWSEVLLASLTIQLVGLAVPICTQIVIDKVVVHHTTSTLIVIATALFIFLIFTAAMGWVRQYLVLHTGNRIDATLGHKVFSHLLDLPVRYYDHRPTGVIIARVHGVETIREFLAGGLVTLLLDFPFLIVFLAIMFWYSWQLTLISVAGLALIAIISFIVTPIIRAKLNHQFMLGARNQAFLTEYVSGMETVKSLQMEPQLKQTFGNYLSTYLNASFDSRKLSITYNTAANTLDQLQTLAILCVGAWLVMHNTNFTIGMLVAFQMFSGRLSGPVLRLVGLWQEFQQADIAVKRLGDVMNAPAEPMTLIPTRANTNQTINITVDSLGFKYSDEHPWLYQNLTFNIQAGHCVVVMGPSGCGKSTLAKLLLGFYQPQEGNIKLNGQDIRYLAANELRNHFGVVPQETVIFSGTIYDNLTLANPHASFEQIIHACQLAEIHNAIEQLPQGYQTTVGEHGTGLSGGQKQRIAIARALLKQPKVLIFDEAVSNLDQQTAEHFAQTVNKLKGKVTILFITHQLPKGLHVDEAVILGKENPNYVKQMGSEKV